MAGPILRHDGFNIAAPGANTNIITSLTPRSQSLKARVSVLLAVAAVFKARITQGATTFDAKFLSGGAVPAGCLYTFDLPLTGVDTYNFQVETDGIIQRLHVIELQGETA